MKVLLRLPEVVAVLAAVFFVGWAVHDYLMVAPERIIYTADLEDGGTVRWSMIDPATIDLNPPLGSHATVRSKILRIGADGGAEGIIGIAAQSSSVRDWSTKHGVDLLGAQAMFWQPQLRAPSLSITADDEMVALVPMSKFATITAIYRDPTGLELVLSPSIDPSLVIRLPGPGAEDVSIRAYPDTQFQLRFVQGFQTSTRSVTKSIVGPSGTFGKSVVPRLFVRVGEDERGADLSPLEPRGPRIYLSAGAYRLEGDPKIASSFKPITGSIDVHTRVRTATVGLNAGQLSIGYRGDIPVDRTEVLHIQFSEERGGELNFNSQDGKVKITDIADSVKIEEHEQLGKKLYKWNWPAQSRLLLFAIPLLLKKLAKRRFAVHTGH